MAMNSWQKLYVIQPLQRSYNHAHHPQNPAPHSPVSCGSGRGIYSYKETRIMKVNKEFLIFLIEVAVLRDFQ